MGISSEHLPHIFERFYRAASTDSVEARSGGGLGLAIAQAIANAHGGKIDCQTTLGQGSVFTVILPLPAHDTSSPISQATRVAAQ
jgi:two-component system OmpR family sensor kinase